MKPPVRRLMCTLAAVGALSVATPGRPWEYPRSNDLAESLVPRS